MARLGAARSPPARSVTCFLCQQAAEKCLKALLQELGLPIKRTHDLEELFDELMPHHPALKPLRRGLVFLSGYAVAVRYPGKTARLRQMRAALRWAGRTRQVCRRLLGIRDRGKS